MTLALNIFLDIVMFIVLFCLGWYTTFYSWGLTYCSLFECTWEYTTKGLLQRIGIFVFLLIVFIFMMEYTLVGAVSSIFGSFTKEKFLNNDKKEEEMNI